MSQIRIGLIGAGWVSEHHLDAYATMADRVKVVAIVDPSVTARRARANKYGIEAAFASADEMFEQVELDAVDIASPREFHIEGCLKAAQYGLPILCQKPLAPSFAEAQELVTNLPAGTRLMVNENWRFREHYRHILRWLEEGRIGTVRQVSMRVLTSGLVMDADGNLPALLRQPMLIGLDRMLLMEILIHHVDTLRFLFGPLDLLGAVLGKECNAISGEDRATLLLTTNEQAAITITGDLMAHGHKETQVDQLEIFGSDGTILLDGHCLSHLHGKETLEKVELDLAANYKASYLRTISHFLDCIHSGTRFETSPEDNLQTLEIVERAYAFS